MNSQIGWAVKNDNFPLCGFDITVQFEKLAEAVGCIGVVVEDPKKLDDVIKECLNLVRTGTKHVLLNVICARDC
jgi:thiamine pyrophosphate-dependent acetolactate synthase large subunit-like protein